MHAQLLCTSRLRLQPLKVSDAVELFEPFSDPRLYTFIPKMPPESLSDITHRFKIICRGNISQADEVWLNWVVRQIDTCKAVGFIELTIYSFQRAGLAYYTFNDFQRRGYAKEACASVVDFVKEARLARVIFAEMDSRNMPSIALIRSLGFLEVAYKKDADYFKGASSHEFVYEKAIDNA